TIDISSFDTGAVTNMSHMFGGMKKLTNIILSNTNVNLFNTANVTDMSHMFAETKLTDYSYILGREAFNTGNVADMSYMFASVSEVSSLNIRSFDVSNLTNVSYMFAGAEKLDNVDFPDEFITNVTDASGLFKGTAFTTLNLAEFNTSNATNMSYMFADMTNLTTIEVSDTFNTDNVSVINSENMFLNTLNIIGFAGTKYDSSHVDKYYAVVDGSVDSTGAVRKGYFTTGTYTIYPNWYEGTENKSSISEIHITKYPESAPTGADDEWVMKGGLQGYRVGDVVTIYINKDKRAYMAEDSTGLFSDFKNVTVLDGLDNLITTKVNNMSSMFEGLESLVSIDLTSFDTSTVSNMKSMFKGMKSLTTLDITNFDTSKVTDMSHMFEDVESLSSLDLTRVVTGEVKDMSYMFKGMKNISSLELVDFNTEKVENMSFMFSGMTNATSINTEFFNTENVRSMSAMFDGCENLLEAKVARFNTSNVTNMAYMFDGAKSLESIDLRSFNVSNVLSFNSMFNNVSSVSELDLFSFVPTSATDASNMFRNMTKLTTIYASARFELATTVSSSGMFASASNLVGGAGTVYSDMHTDSEYARLDKGAVRPGYFSGQYYFAHLFAMGGTFADGTDEKVVKIYGDEPTNKFEIPTYPGYTFDNYYVNGSVINDTWIYSSEKEAAVIARWTPKDYKIYYTSGGGVGTMDADTVSFKSNVTFKNNTFTKEGYDFADWSIDGNKLSDITAGVLSSGRTISDYIWNYVIDNNINSITLTALWSPKTYTIVYNGNEGATLTGDTEYIENNIDYGSTHTLYENKFIRDGWTFNGWSIHSSDSDRKYGDKAEFNLAGYTQTINLYAKWIKTDAIYGKLILHGNGGKVNGLDDDEILLTRYNTVPKAEVNRVGYKFIHWASGSEIVDYPEVCDFKEMELTASWSPINYNIRYYSNDGTDYYTEFIATYNEPFKIRDYEGSNRFGYKFVGWTDDPYGTTV
ncbi:MAG: BspA family leucine-rich repeat surface protein, partial [Lachnospiraceae bacterium]|nr:BspA family leucine-rich repeat surface protein [Lachnospiraceae bacterium]